MEAELDPNPKAPVPNTSHIEDQDIKTHAFGEDISFSNHTTGTLENIREFIEKLETFDCRTPILRFIFKGIVHVCMVFTQNLHTVFIVALFTKASKWKITQPPNKKETIPHNKILLSHDKK